MSEQPRWIQAARCADIPLREGRAVRLGRREVAIFNLGDEFLAVGNRCPHREGPLADGIVSGRTVVCPLHAWKVDLASGAVVRPAEAAACVERFDVRVEGGSVLVEVAMGPTEACGVRPTPPPRTPFAPASDDP